MTCLTKEQKYRNMAANKSKGTKLEVLFGKLLWNAGVRYRKNDNKVFGTPDFVIRKMKIAIFCDGEFWHGRDWKKRKADHKSNCVFGTQKLNITSNETVRSMSVSKRKVGKFFDFGKQK